MKKTKNMSETRTRIFKYMIIPLLIVLPLIYIISLSSAENENKSHFNSNFSDYQIMPPDSLLLKLQSAIDTVNKNPNEGNYLELSYQYYMNGMYQDCIASAQKVLQYNSNSYMAYNNMCAAYNNLGMWDKAITAGQYAIALIPGAQLVSNNLQVSVDGKIKLDKDIIDAEALVKTSPTETNYVNLGYMYYQAGEFELSISAYKKVIALNKNNVVAYNNICSAYNELKKWTDASVYCKKALAVDSTFILSKNNLNVANDNLKK